MTDSRTQISLQYASKYVLETIDESDYRGYTDLIGLEGRYDITKRWDAGLRGMRLHSYSINQEKFGTGASVGSTPAGTSGSAWDIISPDLRTATSHSLISPARVRSSS